MQSYVLYALTKQLAPPAPRPRPDFDLTSLADKQVKSWLLEIKTGEVRFWYNEAEPAKFFF